MKQDLKTIGIILASIIGVIALYVFFFVIFFPYLHNQTLNRFSYELLSIPTPEKTQVVDSLTLAGHQTGNSNHCDYLAAQLIKTDLPKSEIEKFYKDNYKGESEVRFFWINEEHKPGLLGNPTEIYTLDEWVDNKSVANLIVYVFEVAMTMSFDYRCR